MCDNTCAIGIATDSIKQKRSKSIDMRFHWVRDRVRQGQFIISHIRTELNIADYFTKNLDPIRHNILRPYIVTPTPDPDPDPNPDPNPNPDPDPDPDQQT